MFFWKGRGCRARSVAEPSTTYCMGYWPIPGNAKNPAEHYETFIPRTVAMLSGQRMVLFTDDLRTSQIVAQCCKRSEVDLLHIGRSISDLPGLPFARDILRQTECYGRDRTRPEDFQNEKGSVHYWRDFIGSGPQAYEKILAIWLSKVFLIHEVVQHNPFDSEQFAWVDASVARFN